MLENVIHSNTELMIF